MALFVVLPNDITSRTTGIDTNLSISAPESKVVVTVTFISPVADSSAVNAADPISTIPRPVVDSETTSTFAELSNAIDATASVALPNDLTS